jgi:regulator of CtrA degradation
MLEIGNVAKASSQAVVNLTKLGSCGMQELQRRIPFGSAMATVHLLHKTLDETLALLVRARDYMTYAAPSAQPGLQPAERLQISCEAMRVTARLSHVMAWLLAQKAVQAGEISPMAAAAAYRLNEDDISLLEGAEVSAAIPEGLCDLLEKSRALYVRVTRLDALVQHAASA